MTRDKAIKLIVVAVVVAAALALPSRAGAIEVKKSLYNNPPAGAPGAGPATKNPYSQAQMQKLNEAVAGDTDAFTAQESEKKASGQVYADLESARPKYFPEAGGVTARLEAVEYKAPKNGVGKGSPTGKKRTLVLKYKLAGSKWVQLEAPKWEEAGAAPAAAAKK